MPSVDDDVIASWKVIRPFILAFAIVVCYLMLFPHHRPTTPAPTVNSSSAIKPTLMHLNPATGRYETDITSIENSIYRFSYSPKLFGEQTPTKPFCLTFYVDTLGRIFPAKPK
jgi:hypothetical protein